jgi:NADH-quinone oxidoreductase subunit A
MKAPRDRWSSNAETQNSSVIYATDRLARTARTPFILQITHRPAHSSVAGNRHLNEAVTSLWPFVVYFIAVLLLVATMLGLSFVLGQRRANKATNMPFESGVLSVGSPQIHMAVEFYLVAIFFVIFDLETVFIFAWAVAFFELGWEGFIAVIVFVLILGVALIYELSTGALDWGLKTRTGKAQDMPHPEVQD